MEGSLGHRACTLSPSVLLSLSLSFRASKIVAAKRIAYFLCSSIESSSGNGAKSITQGKSRRCRIPTERGVPMAVKSAKSLGLDVIILTLIALIATGLLEALAWLLNHFGAHVNSTFLAAGAIVAAVWYDR